jgi:hypothetical protein
MTNTTAPVLSAAQHAVHTLKEYADNSAMFPREALAILQRFVTAAEKPPSNTWPNCCYSTAPMALRHLAKNERPSGGEAHFNTAHLLQIADELEQAARNTNALPATKNGAVGNVEALLTKISDDALFEILSTAGRVDTLDYRLPGTSRTHKVTCAILENADMPRLRGLLAKA